jgi:hypothetical protein
MKIPLQACSQNSIKWMLLLGFFENYINKFLFLAQRDLLIAIIILAFQVTTLV